jgi:hypothetical protein
MTPAINGIIWYSACIVAPSGATISEVAAVTLHILYGHIVQV